MKTFLTNESGTVSLDWVVLTSVLAATGLAVLASLRGGVEVATLEVALQLRGQVMRSSFEAALCPGGVQALQAHEDVRAAFAGEQPMDVAAWMSTTYDGMSDGSIRTELLRSLDSVTIETGTVWTTDSVRSAALACEAVSRGLD